MNNKRPLPKGNKMKRVRKPKIAVKYYVETHGKQTPKRIIIHDTESHDHKGVRDILGISRYWKTSCPKGSRLGSQFIIDKDGNIGQGCSASLTTYAVANNNEGSIHIELIGFARFTPKIWLKRRKQMRATVALVAYLSQRWKIPTKRSTVNGIARHSDFHNVPRGYYHSDPGRGYPFALMIRRVRKLKAKHA